MRPFRPVPLFLVCAALVAGCSSTPSGNSRIDYQKKAVVAQPLDVPPPLRLPATGSEGVEVPSGVGGKPAVLPQPHNVRVVRDGDARWLVVEATPEALWPKLRAFFKTENLEIRQEDARVGVFETEWAENRADIPQGAIRNIFSKVVPYLYDSNTRDKYRLRLERGVQPGTTEIYLSHYGTQMVTRGDEVAWERRPSDPELVAEMLSRLMQSLGVVPEAAKSQLAAGKSEVAPRARVVGDVLVIDEGFARAWRLTGLALDRVGLVVEDLNREKGLYYVRQSDAFGAAEAEERGWFGRLFSSEAPEEKRLRLVVKGDDGTSRLSALDDKGQPLPPAQTKAILDRLQEQLR